MMKEKLVVLSLCAVLLVAVAAGGTWAYFRLGEKKQPAAEAQAPHGADKFKYVGAERIVVMLRQPDGERSVPMYSEAHYAALDIVLKTTPENEAAVREQLLLLRSLVVGAVSHYTVDQIRTTSIDAVAAELNRTFVESYKSRQAQMPFETVMISKMLAE
ncbi:flagellar basal body rod protein [Burkholderia territorii]|nr:flagellar basal body rod protein [Burkholderia territorii]